MIKKIKNTSIGKLGYNDIWRIDGSLYLSDGKKSLEVNFPGQAPLVIVLKIFSDFFAAYFVRVDKIIL